MLTQSELKEWLHYDPLTGEWQWIKRDKRSQHLIGEKAGLFFQNRNYYHVSLFKKTYRANKLAWLYITGEWPVEEIVHLDKNNENLIFNNLCLANDLQKKLNSRIYKNNISGHKGVFWNNHRNKYKSEIRKIKNTYFWDTITLLKKPVLLMMKRWRNTTYQKGYKWIGPVK